MADVQADILSSSSVVSRQTHTTTVDRKYRVSAVAETSVEAQAVAIAAVPQPGSLLALTALGVIVRVRTVTAKLENDSSPSVFLVDVQYVSDSFDDPSNPDVPSSSGGVVATEIQTAVDKNGVQITTKRDAGSKDELTLVPVRIPLATIRHNRILELVTPQVPGDIADQFVGFANDRRWNGQEAGFWICTQVLFESTSNYDPTSGSNTWAFSFFFERADPRESTIDGSVAKSIAWNPLAVYVDNMTNKPPSPLVNDESVKEVDWVTATNFNNLLPF